MALLFTSSRMSPSPHRSSPSRPAVQALARASVAAGDLLRAERSRRRLTLRELAARAGISFAAIADIEWGHPASLETYARLATALGLRLERALVSPRRRASISEGSDVVHAAMGEAEAQHLRLLGFDVGLDVPYQHYQFAGRADMLAWDRERHTLLHVENRTRFPNLQEAFGSYNAKRAYLARAVADRLGVRGGWRSQTHVIVRAGRPRSFTRCAGGREASKSSVRTLRMPSRPGGRESHRRRARHAAWSSSIQVPAAQGRGGVASSAWLTRFTLRRAIATTRPLLGRSAARHRHGQGTAPAVVAGAVWGHDDVPRQAGTEVGADRSRAQ